jgi:hypothetical protein
VRDQHRGQQQRRAQRETQRGFPYLFHNDLTSIFRIAYDGIIPQPRSEFQLFREKKCRAQEYLKNISQILSFPKTQLPRSVKA